MEFELHCLPDGRVAVRTLEGSAEPVPAPAAGPASNVVRQEVGPAPTQQDDSWANFDPMKEQYERDAGNREAYRAAYRERFGGQRAPPKAEGLSGEKKTTAKKK